MIKIDMLAKRIYTNMKKEELKNAIVVQSEVRNATSIFLRKEGFVEIPPVIISPITDPLHHATGKAQIEHYGHVYQLTRSMILHKQISLLSLDKIFSFSPNVRLEPIELADTGKHLLEFTQVDLEVKSATREDVINLGERLIVYIFEHVKKHCASQLKSFNRDLKIPTIPFEKISYSDAYEKYKGAFEDVLSAERKEPFWLIDMPIDAREFYDREFPEGEGILKDMDLIYPEGYGEALSGGEREHTYERIVYRMERAGLNTKDFEWYLEFAKLGLPPSAGFGFGVERMTRYICGLKRIEDATLFPKTPGKSSI